MRLPGSRGCRPHLLRGSRQHRARSRHRHRPQRERAVACPQKRNRRPGSRDGPDPPGELPGKPPAPGRSCCGSGRRPPRRGTAPGAAPLPLHHPPRSSRTEVGSVATETAPGAQRAPERHRRPEPWHRALAPGFPAQPAGAPGGPARAAAPPEPQPQPPPPPPRGPVPGHPSPALTGGPGRGGAAAAGAGGDRVRSERSDEKPGAARPRPAASRPLRPMAAPRRRCPARGGPRRPISAAAAPRVTAVPGRHRLPPRGCAGEEAARRGGRRLPGTAVRETRLSSGQRVTSARSAATTS